MVRFDWNMGIAKKVSGCDRIMANFGGDNHVMICDVTHNQSIYDVIRYDIVVQLSIWIKIT